VIAAAAGHVTFKSANVAVFAPPPLETNVTVMRYRESDCCDVADCPALLKKRVVVPVLPAAGILMLNCVDVVAPPRGFVTGVARKSAATADKISADAVCSIDRWFVCRPIGSKLKITSNEIAATPSASVTSTSENACRCTWVFTGDKF